ncbi:MAG: hypothetical protein Ct9H90mP6_09340 [Gammaproteobacteria bacterium]|nr:MAG: hypothetical protein Ct9H90mP6_09340 [Gammaproteobacteria bacterium]
MKTHAGEVSFPGGMMEEIDKIFFRLLLENVKKKLISNHKFKISRKNGLFYFET